MKHSLITGGAGFIGSHLADNLLSNGWRVMVVDNFGSFYDHAIQEANVKLLEIGRKNYAQTCVVAG